MEQADTKKNCNSLTDKHIDDEMKLLLILTSLGLSRNFRTRSNIPRRSEVNFFCMIHFYMQSVVKKRVISYHLMAKEHLFSE